MYRSLTRFTLTIIWLSVFPDVLEAGIQYFDLVLQPTDQFVHYNDGFIRGPGSIDLSGLTFTAISDSYNDDDILEPGTGENTNDDGNNRVLSSNENYRMLNGGIDDDGSVIDIAIFPLPPKCANTKKGCDWAELGVGMRSGDELRWCCSDEAMAIGVCNNENNNYGRLMIDKEKFQGEHRFVNVPKIGPMEKKLHYGKVEVQQSATYVVLYANCRTDGREVKISGRSVWRSKHGFLPGELFGFMYFYTFITIIYFLLFFWYGVLMHIHEDHRIEIEKWILFAITLGLLEMIFRTGDYFVWNADGVRSSFIIWIGILAGVLKQGISRCLLVMVSLGWGVVRDSLGGTMRVIVVLGIAYIGVSATLDLMMVFAIESVNRLTYSEETGIWDIVEILTFAGAAIDSIFIVWVLDALSNTISYLETMNQTRKLERFLKFRCIFLFAVLFSIVWVVFSLVAKYHDEGIVAEEHSWAVNAATEVNYLFVLIGVARLWRPNESAKEYAFVLELPTNLGDNENELELTGVVPSALDDDDDAGENSSNGNGFHERPKEINRFEIS